MKYLGKRQSAGKHGLESGRVHSQASNPVENVRIRVLIVSYMMPDAPCGVSTYYQLLQKHLPKHGVKVDLATPGGCSRHVHYATGLLRRVLTDTRLVRGSFRILVEDILYWIRLCSALARIRVRPDLIHAQDPGSASAAIRTFKGAIPVVTTCHFNDDLADEALLQRDLTGTQAGALRRWYAWNFKHTGDWISVSRYAAERLRRHVPADARIRIVYNGRDFDEFANARLDECLRKEHPGQTLILTVGNLEPRKNQRLVLEVAECLRTYPVVFLLAGDGPHRPWLEMEIRLRGLADRVRLLGYRRDIAAVMRACTIYFHPALKENCPFAVIEAIAAGLPVLASESGGIPEIFKGTESESCFAVSTPAETIASRIRLWVEDPEFRKAVAQRQRAAALREFSLRQMIRNTIRVYQEILSKVPPGLIGDLPAVSPIRRSL